MVKGGKQLTKQIQATSFSSLDVLPSSMAYRYLSILFDAKKHSHHRLEKRLEELSSTYDLVIIDASPPTMSLVSENVLYASDMLLVPVVPTPFAVLAYDQLLGELERLEQKDTRVHLVVSMLDRRKKLQLKTAEGLLHRSEALQSVIPFASEIEKMGEIQKPVVTSNPKGKGALAFRGLYEELVPFLMERSPSGRAEKKELNR